MVVRERLLRARSGVTTAGGGSEPSGVQEKTGENGGTPGRGRAGYLNVHKYILKIFNVENQLDSLTFYTY